MKNTKKSNINPIAHLKPVTLFKNDAITRPTRRTLSQYEYGQRDAANALKRFSIGQFINSFF